VPIVSPINRRSRHSRRSCGMTATERRSTRACFWLCESSRHGPEFQGPVCQSRYEVPGLPAYSQLGYSIYKRTVVSAALPAVSTVPLGKYALCTYCRTIRCVLKKLALIEMAERITSAYANGRP
jgi:hypothetical protein